MGPAARRTDSGDQEPVAAGPEPVGQAHGVPQPQDLVISELDDPVARRAVQVVVGGVAVIVLEGVAIRQPQLAEQARVHQEPQGPVDGGTTDALAGIVEVPDQLIRVEMLV